MLPISVALNVRVAVREAIVPVGALVIWGLQLAPANHQAALGPGVNVAWVALLGFLIFARRPSARLVAGALLCASGVVLIACWSASQSSMGMLAGDAMFLAASALGALYVLQLRSWGVGAIQGAAIVTFYKGTLTLQSISDGTSNTFLIGEKHIRPNSLRGKSEDRSVFGPVENCVSRRGGWQPNGTNDRPLMAPSVQGQHPRANQSFGGPHAGVCMFVFCDGSVRAVPLSVDLWVLSYLCNRMDHQAVNTNF